MCFTFKLSTFTLKIEFNLTSDIQRFLRIQFRGKFTFLFWMKYLKCFFLSRDYNFHSDGVYHNMVRAFWDSLQLALNCCGTLSSDDWSVRGQGQGSIQTYAVSREEMDQTVPESCSAEESGCVAMLSSWFSTNFLAVILVTAGLMAFQVLGVCLSCCLARSVQVGHLQI